MAKLRKGTIQELPASSRTEPYHTPTTRPSLRSPSNINASGNLVYQFDHTPLAPHLDVYNESSPSSPGKGVYMCANADQCEQLLERARPSEVIKQINVDISYDGAWDLDKLQLAKELAHKAPGLKKLQLKCFIPLQGEREIRGPFAEFAIETMKLHPLLKKLIHRAGEDDLHVYYTFVTSDYKLDPKETLGLRECDRFSGLLKERDFPEPRCAVSKSLERVLEVDARVGLICKIYGHGMAWLERGGDCIKKLSFQPSDPWDFAGWTKRQFAQHESTRRSNEEKVLRHQSTRGKRQHLYHNYQKKQLRTEAASGRVCKPWAAKTGGLSNTITRDARVLKRQLERASREGYQVSQ